MAEYETGGMDRYERLARVVRDTLQMAIADLTDVRVLVIQHRAKDIVSLRKKVTDRRLAEDDDLEQPIKDLAGCRIIAYTNTDVQRLLGSGMIRDNFEVDWDRTKIHYPLDNSGAEQLFVSYNYVVKLNEGHPTPDRTDLAGLYCEVQVQTLLDHAWSEMAHDTIYKPPAPGLGSRQVDAIRKRLADTMRDHIFQAGFDFQKVAHDAAELRKAQDLEDRDPLQLLATAGDNAERYSLLESLKELLIPHYDNLADRAPRIRDVLEQVVGDAKRAEEGGRDQGEYHYASAGAILRKVCGVIDRLRFVDVPSVTATFDVLVRLYREAADGEDKKTVLSSAERLSEHDLHIWQTYGPLIERLLMDHISRLPKDVVDAARPLVVQTLEHVLTPDVTGTTNSFDAVTFHQGGVAPSRALDVAREQATGMLEGFFDAAATDDERRQLLQAMHAGTGVARQDSGKPAMHAMILRTAARFVWFCLERWPTLSFEVRQAIERKILRLHKHRGTHGGYKRSREVKNALASFKAAVVAFRRVADADPDYVVFKTLFGFDVVLAPYWDGDDHDRNSRDAEVVRLVGEVDEASMELWRQRIERCAISPQIDGMDPAYFSRFLAGFARSKPDLAATLLDPPIAHLDIYLDDLLAGFDGGPAEAGVLRIVDRWIGEGVNLAAVARYYWRSPTFDKERFKQVFQFATAHADAKAIHDTLRTSGERFPEHPDLLKSVMLPAIGELVRLKRPNWVDAVVYSKAGLKAMEALSNEDAQAVLGALLQSPVITNNDEEILGRIAPKHPQAFADFIGERVAAGRDGRGLSFEAIPFEFHVLPDRMKGIADTVISTARRWFTTDQERFRARDGYAVARLFPKTSDIEPALAPYVASGRREDIAFVVAILRSYFDGASATSTICRDIVAALPGDDDLLEEVSTVIETSGMLSGAFGGVGAKQGKRDYMSTWLKDTREPVSAFAERQIRDLERGMAADQRRSMEQLQLRKRNWGVA